MSIADFIDTIAPAPDFLKAIWAESRRKGLNKMTMRQVDAEIATARREMRQQQAAKQPTK
jgi:hypothetical protein